MTFIWSCMVLAFKVTLGGFFWGMAISIIGFILAFGFSILNDKEKKNE